MRLIQLALGCALAAVAWAPPAVSKPLVPPNPNTFGPWKDLDTPAYYGVGNGRRLYMELSCFECHGTTGAGGGRAPSLQPSFTGGISLDQVYNVLMRGEPYGGMPSFAAYVTMDNIIDIYNYINTLGTPNTPNFFEWWVNNPTY